MIKKALQHELYQFWDLRRGKIPVFLVGATAGWAIEQNVYYITKHWPNNSPFVLHRWPSKIPPAFCLGIVHFYSRYSLLTSRWPKPLKFCRVAGITWFHGDPGERNTKFGYLGDKLAQYLPHLKFVITSCALTAKKLLRWGVSKEKIKIVPLGVDVELFPSPTQEEKRIAKQKFGIPRDSICIASFQKDGIGWGDGLEPKLEKGPDIFLKVIERLRREYRLFVLLTAPARGYVIKGLNNLSVPYLHSFVEHHSDLVSYYHAADIYLITSREEGGPLALLESLSSGLPVVSTKVGMAPDVIIHGKNGFLADVEDVDALANKVATLADNPELRKQFAQKGRETAMKYSWAKVVTKLMDVYSECWKA